MVFGYKKPVPTVRYLGITLVKIEENIHKEVHAFSIDGTPYVGASADKLTALEEILKLLGLTRYSLIDEEDIARDSIN